MKQVSYGRSANSNNRKKTKGRTIQTVPVRDHKGNVVDQRQITHRPKIK